MTRDGILGWAVLLPLLVAASALLVMAPIRRLERALRLQRSRRPLRGLAVAAGAVALWHVIPLLVYIIYRAA